MQEIRMVRNNKIEGILPIIAYLLVILLSTSMQAFSAMIDKTTTDFWEDQCVELSRQISTYGNALGKRAVADEPEVFDSNSLIWDADRPTYTLYSMKPDGSDIISRSRQLTSALEILSVCECDKGE
jgi:hypothetical protein